MAVTDEPKLYFHPQSHTESRIQQIMRTISYPALPVKKIVDNASSIITYTGYSSDRNALTSEAKWLIFRSLTQGGVTTTVPASYEEDQVFDDRADGIMFPDPVLTNTESLLFDGLNDEVNHGDVFQYDAANQFSISMWCKPDNLAATRNLFAKTTPDSNVYGWNLRHNVTTGALFLQMRASGTLRAFTFSSTLTAATWQHVVFTYNGASNINGARVYVDDVVGSTPTSGSLNSMLSGQDFTLGSRNGAFEFSGNIDQVTVWDKALSSSEVTTLYNSGSPGDPTIVSFNSNLVSWFPIGKSDEGDSSSFIFDNHGSNDGALTGFAAEPYESDVA